MNLPHIKITQPAYQILSELSRAAKRAGSPRSLQSLASEAILALAQPASQPETQQPYILLSFHGLADENNFPELVVCHGIANLVRAMRDRQDFAYTEVLRVLPNGATQRLGNNPSLE